MLIFILAFIQVQFFVNSQIIWPGIGEECNIVGSLSRVVCLTETDFKFSLDSSEIYSCPLGTVCANHQNICVNCSRPVCTTPRCGRCLPGATGTCISTTQYINCNDTGSTTVIMGYCPASQPLCKVDYENGIPVQICSVIIPIDCDNSPATPPPPPIDPPTTTPCPTIPLPPPQHDNCTIYGVFESKTDPTCKRYYYCNYSNGQLVKSEYACSVNLVFHPEKRKCVLPKDYTCRHDEV